MTFVLLLTCFKSPYDIAFQTLDSPLADNLIDWIINGLFFIDVIIIFNTVFYNEDFEKIDTRKSIALEYIKGWFIIDFICCIPFDVIVEVS